ncbi:DUF4198 domain-containing protein [Psychromonas sp. B3M02]|uniref:DUF4198 domain-containing protein n=1 Tax=Psychromonas sp. B3M02 TaxID=2267226 RepID=UPI000DEBCA49|nr:DUF4198 domain-containing protein [Psychromonas sp. B3M02]RBW47990.1 DUF4198 domain-containing protein [Psychromonas sp. B3M02]
MLSKKISTVAVACAMLGGLTLSQVANAHPRWIMPSHFAISKEGGDWLAFDITASHGTFVLDKPAGAENARIVMPDGRQERPDAVLRGKRRSVFDFHFTEEGTHRVQVNNFPSYVTHYKAGKRDTQKRLRASKVDRAALLPEGARDVISTLFYTRAETYITVGKPSEKPFPLEGTYLELKPETNPADIVATEPVRFQLFFNGKPQVGVKAEITRDGTLYRNQQEQIDVVTDEQGFIEFTPEVAGRYLLKATHKAPIADNPLADNMNVSVHLTFEAVLP